MFAPLESPVRNHEDEIQQYLSLLCARYNAPCARTPACHLRLGHNYHPAPIPSLRKEAMGVGQGFIRAGNSNGVYFS